MAAPDIDTPEFAFYQEYVTTRNGTGAKVHLILARPMTIGKFFEREI
jgi:hypothetical protein